MPTFAGVDTFARRAKVSTLYLLCTLTSDYNQFFGKIATPYVKKLPYFSVLTETIYLYYYLMAIKIGT